MNHLLLCRRAPVIERIFLRASFLLEVEWIHHLRSGCSRRISSILFYENAFSRWKEFLERVGEDTECAVCQEAMVAGDNYKKCLANTTSTLLVSSHGWMNTIRAPYVGTRCPPMTLRQLRMH